jgi:hypothetical protein
MARAPARQEEPRRRATYEDLLAVPEHLVAEIIDGELTVSPRPASRHALAGSAIGYHLMGPFHFGGGSDDAPGGWWILDEPRLRIGEDDIVPDLAGWRRERLPVLPPDVVRWDVMPDWVCEVISPSTASVDRMKKMPLYAGAGVRHVWLVDPIARTLEVYRLEGSRWIVAGMYGGDIEVRAEPFDAVPLPLARWWVPEAAPAAGRTPP